MPYVPLAYPGAPPAPWDARPAAAEARGDAQPRPCSCAARPARITLTVSNPTARPTDGSTTTVTHPSRPGSRRPARAAPAGRAPAPRPCTRTDVLARRRVVPADHDRRERRRAPRAAVLTTAPRVTGRSGNVWIDNAATASAPRRRCRATSAGPCRRRSSLTLGAPATFGAVHPGRRARATRRRTTATVTQHGGRRDAHGRVRPGADPRQRRVRARRSRCGSRSAADHLEPAGVQRDVHDHASRRRSPPTDRCAPAPTRRRSSSRCPRRRRKGGTSMKRILAAALAAPPAARLRRPRPARTGSRPGARAPSPTRAARSTTSRSATSSTSASAARKVRLRLTNAYGGYPPHRTTPRCGSARSTSAGAPAPPRPSCPGRRRRSPSAASRPCAFAPAATSSATPCRSPWSTATTSRSRSTSPARRPTPATTAAPSRRSYMTPANGGDRAAQEANTGFTSNTTSWWFLDAVSVETSDQIGAVVALGDSITDGANSTSNTNRRWTDYLANRLNAVGNQVGVRGVVNEGISGNSVLKDFNCCGGNPSGLSRLDRDVISHDGVTTVIVALGHQRHRQLRRRRLQRRRHHRRHAPDRRQLHRAGLKVIWATLTPFEGTTLAGLLQPGQGRQAEGDQRLDPHRAPLRRRRRLREGARRPREPAADAARLRQRRPPAPQRRRQRRAGQRDHLARRPLAADRPADRASAPRSPRRWP